MMHSETQYYKSMNQISLKNKNHGEKSQMYGIREEQFGLKVRGRKNRADDKRDTDF